MELFKRFDETIIYKKDSELEKQIEVLKKLNREYLNNYNIEKKLKFCELGLKGEKEIEFELKNANLGMYVLHDITLQFEDLTAQIDYMVITKGFTYLIECKNLIGDITVNNRGEFIREYELKGKKVKEGFYSPIRQAERHLEVFKKIWNQRNNTIWDRLVRSKNLDYWFRPLVVMANSKNILNTKYAPQSIRNKIIKSDGLVNYIKKDIYSIEKDLLSNRKEMEQNAKVFFNSYNKPITRNYEEEYKRLIINYEIKKENQIEQNVNQNDDLKEILIQFRKNIAKEKNIPAYYVFTNEELEKLVISKPKTIEDLRKLNILKEIKVKAHGQKIIEIINQ